MKFTQALAIVALLEGSQAAGTAKEQSDIIWNQILATKGSNMDFSISSQAAILTMDMKMPFEQTDYMQKTGWFTKSTRPKPIHTKGTVQQVRWENIGGHNYTGLFSSGADFGIMRYSIAKPYDMKKWGKDSNFLPGMGIKWYRDGIHTGNLQAMPGFDPTQSPNFFENNFTNHVKPIDDTAIAILSHLFAKGSKYATSMGLRDWAEYGKSGSTVNSPSFPFQLVYEPQVKLDATIPPSKSFDDMIIETLTQKDQLIWKVFAVDGPNDCDNKKSATHIGNIYSEGPAIKSMFADKNVMFQHNDMTRDVELNPSWEQDLATFVTPGLDQFSNDKDMLAKFGDAATAGCPYMAMMNMLY